METTIRNRVTDHRRVHAGDLVPHEWNFRLHPDAQKGTLQALYQEVGFARSLLGFELPDGWLKLIDGHPRREIDPAMEVEVEILDLNKAEARELLLSIDPQVQMGQMQEQFYERLRQNTPTEQPELEAMWAAAAPQTMEDLQRSKMPIAQEVLQRCMLLVMCKDEKQQRELLERFQAEGLDCKCLLS